MFIALTKELLTKCSLSRFSLPLDFGQLAGMSVVSYLGRYVSVGTSRRQLYDKVFTRNRSSRDGLLTEEAAIKALTEVMGGDISKELEAELWESLGVEIAPHIENKFNYKEFAGIAAVLERLFCFRFCKGDRAGPTQPKVG